MNPKITKLKEEFEKNNRKISSLQARNKKIAAAITEMENTDIIGMVREFSLSPDELMELLCTMKKAPIPDINNERLESETHEK